MTDWTELFKQAQARSFRSLLTDLAALRKKEVPSPDIIVHLKGGDRISGNVITFEQGHQQDILVLQTADSNSRFSSGYITYVNGSDISMLSLSLEQSAEDTLAGIISGGKITSMNKLSLVSRLNIQRYLKEQSDILAALIHAGFSIEISESLYSSTENFSMIKSLAESICGVLQFLVNDPMGKEAVLAKVAKVVLTPAPAFSIVLSVQELVVSFNPQERIPVNAEELRLAIEKVL